MTAFSSFSEPSADIFPLALVSLVEPEITASVSSRAAVFRNFCAADSETCFQLDRAFERCSGQVGIVDRASVAGESQGLRTAARQVRRSVNGERRTGSVIFQAYVDVVVNRARSDASDSP